MAIDQHALRELELYLENDYQTYQQVKSIEQNLARKQKSGKYDHSQAPKLWMYAVDAAAKKYVKEFGGSVATTFPKQTREALAKKLADDYLQGHRLSGLGILPGIGAGPLIAAAIGFFLGRRTLVP